MAVQSNLQSGSIIFVPVGCLIPTAVPRFSLASHFWSLTTFPPTLILVSDSVFTTEASPGPDRENEVLTQPVMWNLTCCDLPSQQNGLLNELLVILVLSNRHTVL